MENYFDVQGYWESRHENPDELARRLALHLESLVPIDPLFKHWARDGFRNRSIVPREITLPARHSELCDWIAENPVYVARDGRKACLGHSIHARTASEGEPLAMLYLTSRPDNRQSFLDCRMRLTVMTPKGDPWSLRRVAKPMLLALAAAWDVAWAGVATSIFSEKGHQPGQAIPTYQAGWMVYLDEGHARRIADPGDVRVERQPNGGLLLIATDEMFSHRNQIHRAAARRIERALAPLNAEQKSATKS